MVFFAPNNFKKARHIGGLFRYQDLFLIMAAAIIFIPIIIVLLTQKRINYFLLSIVVIMFLFIIFLVQPFPPIYHNFLVFFQVLYLFIKRKKKFIWGGVIKYEEKIEE